MGEAIFPEEYPSMGIFEKKYQRAPKNLPEEVKTEVMNVLDLIGEMERAKITETLKEKIWEAYEIAGKNEIFKNHYFAPAVARLIVEGTKDELETYLDLSKRIEDVTITGVLTIAISYLLDERRGGARNHEKMKNLLDAYAENVEKINKVAEKFTRGDNYLRKRFAYTLAYVAYNGKNVKLFLEKAEEVSKRTKDKKKLADFLYNVRFNKEKLYKGG